MQRLTLDPHLRIGFISDLHLDPGRPDIADRFHAFLAGIEDRLDVLFILGDLFEYWVGDDGIDRCGYRDYVAALASAADRLDGLHLMHGNRDFLMGEALCRETGCTLVADPCVADIGGLRVLLAHGDAYCTDDIGHMSFRGQVRQAAWQLEFLSQPLTERLDFARRARAASELGKAEKSMQIMDVNRNAVEQALEQSGVRLMIHGHTHRPGLHRYRIGGRERLRAVLGAWFDQVSSMTLDGERLLISSGGVVETVELAQCESH